jgi:hypothetical protein
MKIFILVIICFSLLSCQNNSTQKQNSIDKPGATTKDTILPNGYWQIPKESRSVRIKDGILSPGNYLFFYDNNYITISLLTEKEWMWKSEDDFYKLKAKWGHDSLFYLPPFGRWTYLAEFDGKNFSVTEQDTIFKYYKIEKDEISKEDVAILKERKLHDYNIKATDRWDK